MVLQEKIRCPWCGDISSLLLDEAESIWGRTTTSCNHCGNAFEVIWGDYGLKSSFPRLQLYEDTRGELSRVEEALEAEGFNDPGILQNYKEGQVFGVVKDLDETWQMHVRGYKDGSLEAEIEISRWHLEHLQDSPLIRRSAHQELGEILHLHGIYYTTNSTFPYQEETLQPPATVTDWRPIAAILGIAIIGYCMFRSR